MSNVAIRRYAGGGMITFVSVIPYLSTFRRCSEVPTELEIIALRPQFTVHVQRVRGDRMGGVYDAARLQAR